MSHLSRASKSPDSEHLLRFSVASDPSPLGFFGMGFASSGAMLDFPYLEIPRRDFVERLNLPPESARSAERLFIQGKPEAFALLDELPRQGLAIVGTRTPQPRATTLVRRWVQAWSHSDRIILSGLAIGVDTAAHEAALESGLPTIAILATGLRQIYPRQNAALAARILDNGGLLIAEELDPTEVRPRYFLDRNRWIAAFSSAVWMVQAADRSGALNTASWARKFERGVYVTPCFPDDPAFAGNQKLVDEPGTQVLWSPHHLGQTWLDLSGIGLVMRRAQVIQLNLAFPKDPDVLAQVIRHHSVADGGSTVPQLLAWSRDAQWDSARLFSALQRLLETGAAKRGAGGIFFTENR